ncbi:hypothetical protein RhiXN_08053 [Rhizoctonia solani]|uniref:Uncharacterized protein n=1 Tax=Rhizoctonia solani TaxID=456999 RepID=A0A8H8P2B9_9AGAM|nr:uncharacterized protein RhiXN_08053 [Rhizoctonia solani]QRW23017.1 hypothetical protein RhiXN_08053 [Rhizoctonia solani]
MPSSLTTAQQPPHPNSTNTISHCLQTCPAVLFLGLFSGAIYGAMVLSKQFSGAIESTKDGLKKRGLDITENGLSVKTEKRLERDDYIDGTGRYGTVSFRNLVDALKVASFGSPENQRAAVPDTIGQGYAPPGTRHRASLSKKH